jgi:hypothetical protein
MNDDLMPLVRATYRSALVTQRNETVAFERAVGIVLGRQGQLSIDEARRQVAVMLRAGSPRDRQTGTA